MVGSFCSAPNCSNSYGKVRLFRIPKNPERRKLWIINSRRANWEPKDFNLFYEVHFEKGEFESHRADGKKKLKWNSVPTLFSFPNPPMLRLPMQKPDCFSFEKTNTPLVKAGDHRYCKPFKLINLESRGIKDLDRLRSGEEDTPFDCAQSAPELEYDILYRSVESLDALARTLHLTRADSRQHKSDIVQKYVHSMLRCRGGNDVESGTSRNEYNNNTEDVKRHSNECNDSSIENRTQPANKRHSVVFQSNAPSKSSVVHVCTICSRHFFTRPHFLRHINVHTGAKPHVCDVCGKRFSVIGYLRRHRLNHLDDRRHLCVVCGKRFLTNCKRKAHTMIHTGEKKYQCDKCGARFAQLGTLRLHTFRHTGERPYQCEQCEKRFTRSYPLHQHILNRHGENNNNNECKQFHCGVRRKKFARGYKLTKHLHSHLGVNIAPSSRSMSLKREHMDISVGASNSGWYPPTSRKVLELS